MNDMDNMTANSDVQRLDFNTPTLQRKRRIRALKDHLARWYVSIGGLAVLGAITLIFFYLAQVVLPMFQGAELEARKAQQPAWLADAGKPLLLAIEEQNQVALRLGEDGQARVVGVEALRVQVEVLASEVGQQGASTAAGRSGFLDHDACRSPTPSAAREYSALGGRL